MPKGCTRSTWQAAEHRARQGLRERRARSTETTTGRRRKGIAGHCRNDGARGAVKHTAAAATDATAETTRTFVRVRTCVAFDALAHFEKPESTE